jgi:hypothetical protein
MIETNLCLIEICGATNISHDSELTQFCRALYEKLIFILRKKKKKKNIPAFYAVRKVIIVLKNPGTALDLEALKSTQIREPSF